MTGPATLRHQRSDDGGPGFGREFELQQVMTDIEKRLARLDRVGTREHDDHLGVVEGVAAPYALALFYEVRRLETLLREGRLLRRARHVPAAGRRASD